MSVLEMPAVSKMKKGSPASEPITPERIEEIRLELVAHKDSEELTAPQLAKKINYAAPSVSLFLNGRYPENATHIARAAEAYLEHVKQKRSIGGASEFVETSVSKQIRHAIFVAEAAQKIAVIATQSGLGKSRTIHEYMRNHPKSVHVICSPDLNTPWSLLAELIYQLTRDERARTSSSHARRELVGALQGSTRTIVIDEAQFLSQECLELLRCVQEQAGVALILSGNESIYERGPSKLGGAAAHAQFTSRVVARLHLRTANIQQNDVRMIATQFLEEEVADQAFNLLFTEATSSGGFRRLVTILQLSQMYSKGSPVRKTHIVKALTELKQLGGGDE